MSVDLISFDQTLVASRCVAKYLVSASVSVANWLSKLATASCRSAYWWCWPGWASLALPRAVLRTARDLAVFIRMFGTLSCARALRAGKNCDRIVSGETNGAKAETPSKVIWRFK